MKRPLNPTSIRAPFAQYSHAVEVPAGRMVFASGQLGVSPDDHGAGRRRSAGGAVLREHQGDPGRGRNDVGHVVRFTAYVTDRAYFPVYGAVRSRYVAGNAFASTW